MSDSETAVGFAQDAWILAEDVCRMAVSLRLSKVDGRKHPVM